MNDVLTLTYDLFSLPTAQHRAGLAGLVVAGSTMRARRMADVPEIEVKDSWTARVTLTKPSLTALMNDLYEATTDEMRQSQQRKSRDGSVVPPLRVETEQERDPKSGKQRLKTWYVYPQVVLRAPALSSLGMPAPWLKLWRDAVWSTLRGVPLTRKPYEDRAGGLPVGEAAKAWDDLRKWQKEATRGRQYVSEVASSLYIGAQAKNAEQVPFTGSPDQSLLLHFWPLVMGVGEARMITYDQKTAKEETSGYVMTVPDVADLEGFTADFPASVNGLTSEMAGYRPRDAVLSLPEEGGLVYLAHLAALAQAKASAGVLGFSVTGMEVYHLAKRGNSVNLLATGRVPARAEIVEQYDHIRGQYRNLMFRAQLIRNLLHVRPWYAGFDRVFALRDMELFIGGTAGSFVADIGRKFRTETGGMV